MKEADVAIRKEYLVGDQVCRVLSKHDGLAFVVFFCPQEHSQTAYIKYEDLKEYNGTPAQSK